MGDVKVPEDLRPLSDAIESFKYHNPEVCECDLEGGDPDCHIEPKRPTPYEWQLITSPVKIKELIERIARAEQRVEELNSCLENAQSMYDDANRDWRQLKAKNSALQREIAALRAPVTEAEKPRKIIISHAQVDSDVVAIYGGLPNHFLNSFGSDEEAQTWIDSGEAKKKDALMSQRASEQGEKGNGNG